MTMTSWWCKKTGCLEQHSDPRESEIILQIPRDMESIRKWFYRPKVRASNFLNHFSDKEAVKSTSLLLLVLFFISLEYNFNIYSFHLQLRFPGKPPVCFKQKINLWELSFFLIGRRIHDRKMFYKNLICKIKNRFWKKKNILFSIRPQERYNILSLFESVLKKSKVSLQILIVISTAGQGLWWTTIS